MATVSLPVRRARRSSRPGVWRLLADQLGYALRDLWRTRIVFVFTFLFPLTWLVVLGLVIGNATLHDGVRMMQFITPTAAVMGVLYATLPTMASSLAAAREGGVLKRVRGTPLPAWVYLAGRTGASVVFALGSLVTMVLVGVVAYDVQVIWRTVPATLVTMVVAIASLSACGLAMATLFRSANVVQAASIAVAVVLGFLSGVLVVGDLPTWADRVASVFPLKAFNEAVQGQFDPFASGAGWDLGALALLAAWGAGAGIVAVRRFRWDPVGPPRLSRAAAPPVPSEPATSRVRTTAAPTVVQAEPSWAGLLLSEVRWATRAALRDPGWVFFAVAMPVGLYAYIASAVPAEGTGAVGAPIGLEIAAGMIAWGAAVTGFVNMPEAVAQARDRGALKRLRGTPLSPVLYLAGRTVSALAISLATGALVLLVGLVAFGLEISWAGLPLAAAMLLLGTMSLAACGFALVSLLPSAKAVTAVGLAVLLPLGFFSDVFMFGGGIPDWMSTVGSLMPLKHMANSVSMALDPAGVTFSWTAAGVMVAWLVGMGLVAARTFRWSKRD